MEPHFFFSNLSSDKTYLMEPNFHFTHRWRSFPKYNFLNKSLGIKPTKFHHLIKSNFDDLTKPVYVDYSRYFLHSDRKIMTMLLAIA